MIFLVYECMIMEATHQNTAHVGRIISGRPVANIYMPSMHTHRHNSSTSRTLVSQDNRHLRLTMDLTKFRCFWHTFLKHHTSQKRVNALKK